MEAGTWHGFCIMPFLQQFGWTHFPAQQINPSVVQAGVQQLFSLIVSASKMPESLSNSAFVLPFKQTNFPNFAPEKLSCFNSVLSLKNSMVLSALKSELSAFSSILVRVTGRVKTSSASKTVD